MSDATTKVDVSKMPVLELLERINTVAVELQKKIASLETEIDRLVKARERADEDAALTIKARSHRIDEILGIAGDAMRSLELGDKQGAMGCLRRLNV